MREKLRLIFLMIGLLSFFPTARAEQRLFQHCKMSLIALFRHWNRAEAWPEGLYPAQQLEWYSEYTDLSDGAYSFTKRVRRGSDSSVWVHKRPNSEDLREKNIQLEHLSFEAEVYEHLNPENKLPFLPKSNGLVRNNENRVVLELEEIEGKTLLDYFDQLKSEENFRDSIEQFSNLMIQLIESLQIIHSKGVVHNDLKEANLMVTPEGRLVLIDFGVSSIWNPYQKRFVKARDTIHFRGSPGHTSPEAKKIYSPHYGPNSDFFGISTIIKNFNTTVLGPFHQGKASFSETDRIRLQELRDWIDLNLSKPMSQEKYEQRLKEADKIIKRLEKLKELSQDQSP